MEQISYAYDFNYMVRFMMQHHFESDLAQFDQTLLSYCEQPLLYSISKQLVWKINDFLKKLSDDLIDQVVSRTFESLTLGESVADTQKLFKAFLETDQFKEHVTGTILTDSYVYDRTTRLEYHVFGLGNHAKTIYKIIDQHPELDTVEKQDAFIMNNLIIRGYATDNRYYIDHDNRYGKSSRQNMYLHCVDPHKTVLAYLDLAEKQYDFIRSTDNPKTCYVASYGHDESHDYQIKSFDDFDEMLAHLYAYSNQMVADYFTDKLNRFADHELPKPLVMLGKQLTDNHVGAYIDSIYESQDIVRTVDTFIAYAE